MQLDADAQELQIVDSCRLDICARRRTTGSSCRHVEAQFAGFRSFGGEPAVEGRKFIMFIFKSDVFLRTVEPDNPNESKRSLTAKSF